MELDPRHLNFGETHMTKTFTPTDLPLIPTHEWDADAKDLIDVEKRPAAFVDEDGVLCVSGEDGSGFVDYYGKFRGGYPYIAPELEAWASDNGMYWEWQNPGSIALYEA